MTTVTLELDEDLVVELRAEAERTGRSFDEVASSRLRSGAASNVLDRLWERNRMDEDEAMALAVEEVRAVREERAQQRDNA